MYLLGSILWVLVFRVLPSDASTNMSEVFRIICWHYSVHGTQNQMTNLALPSFCDPSSPASAYPRPKGSGVEIRNICSAILYCVRHYVDLSDEYGQTMEKVLAEACVISLTMSSHANKLFLPPAQVTRLRQAIDVYLACYSRLAKWADDQGDLLFSMVPKFH